jgi:hypothetical protein
MLMSIMRLLWASFPGGPLHGGPYEESVEHRGRLVDALRHRDADDVALAIAQHVIGSISNVRGPARRQGDLGVDLGAGKGPVGNRDQLPGDGDRHPGRIQRLDTPAIRP